MKKIASMITLSLILVSLIGCAEITPVEVLMSLNPGVDTIEIHQTHQDALAKATAGSRSLSVEVLENTVDTSKLGIYHIKYGVEFRSKAYEIIRYVHVIDETPPVILIHAGVDTIFVGDPWIDSGVTITDNSGEIITATTQGTVNTLESGIYEIIYQAVDSSGNTSTTKRIVTVIHPSS